MPIITKITEHTWNMISFMFNEHLLIWECCAIRQKGKQMITNSWQLSSVHVSLWVFHMCSAVPQSLATECPFSVLHTQSSPSDWIHSSKGLKSTWIITEFPSILTFHIVLSSQEWDGSFNIYSHGMRWSFLAFQWEPKWPIGLMRILVSLKGH